MATIPEINATVRRIPAPVVHAIPTRELERELVRRACDRSARKIIEAKRTLTVMQIKHERRLAELLKLTTENKSL